MRKTKLAASLLAVSLAATTLLTGCKPAEGGNSGTSGTTSGGTTSGTTSGESGTTSKTPETPALELKYAAGTTLRMATGYNSPETGLFFASTVMEEDGKVTLADGNTYVTNDLKPTWVEAEKQLNVKFENKYQGKKAADEWEYWKQQLDQVDFVSGTASLLTENGPSMLVNIGNYLDAMPNFKAYLDANPIVRLSITGATTGANKDAIYFSPYFDGVDDIERMPLMRTDWVEKLLNGDKPFEAEKSGNTAAPVYQPYMPTSGSVKIETVKADGSGVEEVTKNYDAYGNIITKMNEKGSMSGVEAVNTLRDYIDKTYGGYYGTNRADLFIGQNAAWDADELVALLRCVVANAPTLNGTDTIYGLFSRNDDKNNRRVDMMRLGGLLFGARGLESRQDYFFIGTDGQLHDARMETATYEAMERMNAMAKEGLISKSFIESSKEETLTMLENDLGFMHYDYNQTQTRYNELKDDKGVPTLDSAKGEKYMAVMVPVAKWDDGDSATPDYMRFTESWRSVKTDGWGISKAGVGLTKDEKVTTQEQVDALPDKLKACLKLIDFAYSDKGMILMSYGPDAFIKTGETFNFNGKEMPVIADKTYEELWRLKSGSYTDYARFYLGSTLTFAKSQAFEYQCTTAVGKEGAAKISKAIALGTIKHPLLEVAENPWWTSVPTVLPNTKMENDEIKKLTELTNKGKFSTSDKQQNALVDLIVGGYSGEGTASRDEMMKTVSDTWGCKTYVQYKNSAWQRLVEYYKDLNG